MPRDTDDSRAEHGAGDREWAGRAWGARGWAGRGWGERLFIVAALAVKLLLLYLIFG